jgi:hypothetical protein
MPAPIDRLNRYATMLSSWLLFFPCLLFVIVLVGWSAELISTRSLEEQIAGLRRELEGYDEMKEQLIRNEIELSWDRQHLQELKNRESEINSSIEMMTEVHEQIENAMREKNEDYVNYRFRMEEKMDTVRQQNREALMRLEEQRQNARLAADQEHEFNIVLHDILDELRELLAQHHKDETIIFPIELRDDSADD